MSLQQTLAQEYRLRFSHGAQDRVRVWRVLIERFFQPLIGDDRIILDLGCGWGEFINHVTARAKFGMDLNPESREYLDATVRFLHQDCADTWPLEDTCLDVVFTSNFLEHLPNKPALERTLGQAYRCLRPGGRIICLGPNLRFLPGEYWDFWDHHIPLSDRSVTEVLRLHGFQVASVHPRFLPYTMARRRPPPDTLIRLYLAAPFAWRFLGRQFLIVAERG